MTSAQNMKGYRALKEVEFPKITGIGGVGSVLLQKVI